MTLSFISYTSAFGIDLDFLSCHAYDTNLVSIFEILVAQNI